jgi:hypothetical protein
VDTTIGRSLDHGLRRYWWAAVLVVLASAALLRLPLSGWWLNPDEGIYFRAIADPSFADFWAEAKASAHPPLYFLILRALGAVSTDFTFLRSVALLSGLGVVYSFMVLGRELEGGGARGRVTGVLAGFLIAVSPRAIALSQVMRPYMLLLLLLSCALIFLLRAARSGSIRSHVAYAACVSLALTLHYSAVGALGVFVVVVVVDGVRCGFGRPRWRRLALAQLAPGLNLLGLYVWHLREMAGSAMADHALGGWLSSFLIRRPQDAWLALVGVHSSLVGDTLAPSAALLTLLGLVWAGWSRRWTILTLGTSSLVIAEAGASLGIYPMGASRHAAWLLLFVTAVLAWALSAPLASPPLIERPRARLAAALLLLGLSLGARPLGSLLDSDRRPREIAERVLRMDAMEAMSEVLSPDADPRLVLMSTETYEILSPLFVDQKDRARVATGGGLTHVPWGRRDVLVLPGRDFAVDARALGRRNHLMTAIRLAPEELGLRAPRPDEHVLVVHGGWQSDGMLELRELARAQPGLGSATYVPGLVSVDLDLRAYRRALGLP